MTAEVIKMGIQAQDFAPLQRRQTLVPVLHEGHVSTITLAGTYTATTGYVISPDIEDFLTAEELAAVAAGEREIAAGDFVTLDQLEQASSG